MKLIISSSLFPQLPCPHISSRLVSCLRLLFCLLFFVSKQWHSCHLMLSFKIWNPRLNRPSYSRITDAIKCLDPDVTFFSIRFQYHPKCLILWSYWTKEIHLNSILLTKKWKQTSRRLEQRAIQDEQLTTNFDTKTFAFI